MKSRKCSVIERDRGAVFLMQDRNFHDSSQNLPSISSSQPLEGGMYRSKGVLDAFWARPPESRLMAETKRIKLSPDSVESPRW